MNSVIFFILVFLFGASNGKREGTTKDKVEDVIHEFSDMEQIMRQIVNMAAERRQSENYTEVSVRSNTPFRLRSFAKAWCKCDTLRGCPCHTENGTDLTSDIEELLVQFKRHPGRLLIHVTEENEVTLASFRSISQKIRNFFKNGFRRLKETFTRRSVDTKHHHRTRAPSKRHPHFIGLPKLRFFVRGIFAAAQGNESPKTN